MSNVNMDLFQYAGRLFDDKLLVEQGEATAEAIKSMVEIMFLHPDMDDLSQRLSSSVQGLQTLEPGCGYEEERECLIQLIFEGMFALTNVTGLLPDSTEVVAEPITETEITPDRFSAGWTWSDWQLIVSDWERLNPGREAEAEDLRNQVLTASEEKRDRILYSVNRMLGYPLGYFE